MVLSPQTKVGLPWTAYIGIAVVGGLVFWTPDLVLKAFFLKTSPAIILTVACPLASIIFYAIMRVFFIGLRHRWLPIILLAGVWLSASPMIAFATLISWWSLGARPPEDLPLVMLMGLLPPYTFIMMTYDGSLFAFMLLGVLCVAGAIWGTRGPLTDLAA